MSFYDRQNEWVLAHPTVCQPLSHRQALNLIARVCKRHGLSTPILLVVDRIGCEVGGKYCDGVISIPGFPVERWIVWHELAHHGCDTRARRPDAVQHGVGFRRWFLRVVGVEAGPRVAESLRRLLE